ncbi:class I SAM-dependent methyltransferase [Sneathiella chinensis]|uniref:Class I SAM-dependent methyltransferase n=1 Tax=Sneathiella chinensis TaxID=349750 RepID=A0ABQ5TZD6_9PROT|nr:class I SAM-dependent methyltransferase [Sneathiella chinensis]GLQ05242.1 hypothetical protein GCM10007924_04630 [Sneathiella chinensis]
MRRLKMGLSTLLGLKKQGFFIPYRYADTHPRPEDRKPYAALRQEMQKQEGAFSSFLEAIEARLEDLRKFSGTTPPLPRFEQDWFPRLDAAAAYTMVREERPKRIIEVGSGHSTRFMMQAIRDGNLDCQFTAIDPAPRADISSLPLTLVNTTLQQCDRSLFETLEAGDILFIDSSHIAMPGTDVDILFLDILPRLPAGVILHVHDIFLPDDYPASWDWRGYNEQQVVAPLFLGRGYDLLFSSAYISRYMTERLHQSGISDLPLQDGAFETSIWMIKRE